MTYRYLWPFAALLLLGGCIEYPNCKTDEHCKDFKEFCIDGKCRKCREDKTCVAKDACGYCEAKTHTCERRKSCCTMDTDCPTGVCRKKPGEQIGRCATSCRSDDQCEPNEECKNGVCVLRTADSRKRCKKDDDCDADSRCQKGYCVKETPSELPCKLEPVYFDFDEFSVSSKAKQVLEKNLKCLRSFKSKVRVEGHADARGTAEYNLALGQRRSNAVVNYLVNSGIDGKRLVSVSYGKEKPACDTTTDVCHGKNRRVEFKAHRGR